MDAPSTPDRFGKHAAGAERILKALEQRSDGQGIPITNQSRVWIGVLCAWGGVTKDELLRVINAMKASADAVSLASFERRLSETRRAASRDEELNSREWTFLVPFPAGLAKGFPLPMSLRVLGTDFELIPWTDAEAHLPKDESNLTVHELVATRMGSDLPVPAHAMRVRAASARHDLAWEKVQPAFDTLRGLVEFEFGQHRFHFGAVESPLHFVSHPRWLVAVTPGLPSVVNTFGGVKVRESEPPPMTHLFLSKISEDSKLLAEAPATSTSLELLADVLRLYAQVRDEDANHRVLLGYWQIAENIVFPQEDRRSGDTRQVAVRLAALQAPGEVELTGLEDVLTAIGAKRNDIVHRGIHDLARFEDLDIVKICAEGAIHWLGWVTQRLPTRHAINEFFTLRQRRPAEIQAMRVALAHIRRNAGRQKQKRP